MITAKGTLTPEEHIAYIQHKLNALGIKTTIKEAERLYREELELENMARDEGALRYTKGIESKQAQGIESKTPYGNFIISHYFEPVKQAIQDALKTSKRALTGINLNLKGMIRDHIPIEVCTMLVLSVLFDACTRRPKIVECTRDLAKVLGFEYRVALFKEHYPQKYKKVMQRFKTSHEVHRMRVLSHLISKHKDAVDIPKLDTFKLTSISNHLLHVAINIMDCFEIKKIQSRIGNRVRQCNVLEPTDDFIRWIDQFNERKQSFLSINKPMVVPPIPWIKGNDEEGGFFLPLGGTSIIKHKGKVSPEEEKKRASELSDTVFDVINHLQNTPWQLNGFIFETLKHARDIESSIGGLPIFDEEKPAKPEDIGINEEATKRYRRDTKQYYDRLVSQKSKRLQLYRVAATAELMEKYDFFFFPYHYDFRGRVYPMVPDFSPYGPDYCKALLDFKEPGFIKNDEDLCYFREFGFSLFDDKNLSIDDFFKRHQKDIIESATNPFGYRFWTEADKPWQFLKFCYYYRLWIENGKDTPIHMPISRDASCSGLQHFASMSGDEKGASLVNVLPSDDKQDIYGSVADKVNETLREHANDAQGKSKYPYARYWLNLKLDRGFTKAPVMTLPYGKTHFGHLSSTGEWIKEFRHKHANSNAVLWHPDEDKKAAKYITHIIESSLDEVLSFAKNIMDWLRQCVEILAKENITPSWKTPTGFRVDHSYMKSLGFSTIKNRVGSRVIQLRVNKGFSNDCDVSAQKNGISPNFVHSLDASHMQDTVVRAVNDNIRSLCMQHDCYGARVDQVSKLNKLLRESFIDLYKQDVLKDLYEQFREQLNGASNKTENVTIPQPPSRKILDIDGVRQSKYFFS